MVEPPVTADERAQLSAERLDVVRAVLMRRDAAAALLTTRRNFAWLTVGGENHVVLETEHGAAPLLVTRARAMVLAPINEAQRIADEELAGLDSMAIEPSPWHGAGSAATAERMAGGPVLDDGALEEDLLPARMVLAAPEQRRMVWLGARIVGAVRGALGMGGMGDGEHEAAAHVVGDLAASGIRAPVVLAAADGRIERYRHPLPTAAPVRRRLMLAVVVERWGLHVAWTAIRELRSPDRELKRRVEATAGIEDRMRAATKIGATLGEVLAEARRAYAVAGYPGEWKLHHQGGAIGYRGRERIAVPGDPTRIQPRMAFAWNPSIAGAKAETTFLLAADGTSLVVTVDAPDSEGSA